MTELTLEALRSELQPIQARLEAVESELRPIRANVEALRSELQPMQAKLDGLAIINRAVTVLQQDMRALKAAFNDFARTNVTAGEIEALHADVNAVQAKNAELEIELATIKRLIEDLKMRR